MEDYFCLFLLRQLKIIGNVCIVSLGAHNEVPSYESLRKRLDYFIFVPMKKDRWNKPASKCCAEVK